MVSSPTVGVLALQGAFARHGQVLESLGATVVEVRTPADLDAVDGLILPGGESTTMSMLLESSELFDPIHERLTDGLSVFGTCAGLILLASHIADGRADQRCFSAIDLTARRNAYGTQIESFEADLNIAGLDAAFPAVFIRAPEVDDVGPGVEVLAHLDGRPVLCRSGSVLVATFHPELSDDDRLHRLFLDEIVARDQ
ncbi:MAG: pyridoxal 5'-phosphate synthase glutaminase subunit PdxT [Acidimicrobiales bacterium]